MSNAMYDAVGRASVVVSNHVGGIQVRVPAIEGMTFHGVPLLPQESPNAKRPRPLFSVNNLKR